MKSKNKVDEFNYLKNKPKIDWSDPQLKIWNWGDCLSTANIEYKGYNHNLHLQIKQTKKS